jgi:type IV pilus assembly protein PilV
MNRRIYPVAHSLLQRGNFMLEALIAILIVALGVLGTVGLYARSLQNVDDAKYRTEAALLANSLVGQMWIDDPQFSSLQAKFDSTVGTGAEYIEFKNVVTGRLPNATLTAGMPQVLVTAGPTATSSNVLITIQWRHPGDKVTDPMHFYTVNATIGSNSP